MMVAADSSKAGSSSQDSVLASVPFRGSSVPKSRRPAPLAAATSSAMSSPHASRAAADMPYYSTWLVLDADDNARPFLSTLHAAAPGRSAVPSGSVSPAARSAEKLTELTNTSAAAASGRKPSASTNVKAQASRFEAVEAKDGANGADKDRRMSLPHTSNAAGAGGSTGRRGFMSRLRGTGGSVSGASVFHPNAANVASGSEDPASVSASGSWSIVDTPTPIKEEAERTPAPCSIHLAYSSLATQLALDRASGLVARCSFILSPSALEAEQVTEQVHSDRLDAPAIAALAQTHGVQALYIGSAQSPAMASQLHDLLEDVVGSSDAGLKTVLVEPATVRRLTAKQAAALFDAARAHAVQLSLPPRWSAMGSVSVDETLAALELLHEVQAEQGRHAQMGTETDEADVSGNFDVSISNIPTGLSSDRLHEAAELAAAKAQVEQLQREIGNRDRRIAELVRQAESAESKPAAVQPSADAEATGKSEGEEVRPATAGTGSTGGLKPQLDEPATPSTPVRLPTQRSPGLGAMSTPVASSSRHLAQVVDSGSPLSPSGVGVLGSAATISASPRGGGGSSGKVIAALTAELSEVQAVLEATRAALQTVRTQAAAHQAAADEMRGTLSRARLENDSSVTILARKDRQISEALERARKAEAEARELGRASREWGTRVREVEDELGKERIKRSRGEQAYEALSAEWKTARERLQDEVRALRESHRDQVQALAKEYDTLLAFKSSLKSHDQVRLADTAQESTSLAHELERVNGQMQKYIADNVHPLLDGMKALEQRENTQIISKLTMLTDELTRIKTLMRRGDIHSPSQIPPSTL